MWMQLLEKAWAKVCGSYEASEMGTAFEAFQNIDGTPCQNFFLAEIDKRNEQAKLWKLLEEADRRRYVVTCSVDSNVRCNSELIKEFGLCDFHSYTMMQCRAIRTAPKSLQVRYLLQLRNPWGKREWLGPWSDHSKAWEKYPHINSELRVRHDKNDDARTNTSTGTLGAADDGRFWILFKDFFQFFYSCTVGYTRDDFYMVRIPEQIPDETWGAAKLKLPKDTETAFLSIF